MKQKLSSSSLYNSLSCAQAVVLLVLLAKTWKLLILIKNYFVWRMGQVFFFLTPDKSQKSRVMCEKEGHRAALQLEMCSLAVLQWVPETSWSTFASRAPSINFCSICQGLYVLKTVLYISSINWNLCRQHVMDIFFFFFLFFPYGIVKPFIITYFQCDIFKCYRQIWNSWLYCSTIKIFMESCSSTSAAATLTVILTNS